MCLKGAESDHERLGVVEAKREGKANICKGICLLQNISGVKFPGPIYLYVGDPITPRMSQKQLIPRGSNFY